MAIVPLTDTQNCANFFQRRVLVNLQYWRDSPAIKTTDVAVLDQERAGLVRAITFALEIDEAWPLVTELITALSAYMERRGYWETWRQVLNQAVETARRVEDGPGTVSLSLLLARLLQRESQLKQAIARYRQTIRLARQVGNEYNEARACSNLGYIYIEQGYWYRAEVLCCHALTIFERIDSNHGLAHTENHLGILYIRQCHWELARQHLERACKIWQFMGDDHGLMRGFINLSLLYLDMERPDEVLTYSEKALQQANLTGEKAEIGTIYMNMGAAYRLSGEFAKAEAYAWQAEVIFRRFSNSVGLACVQYDLGLACLEQKKWQQAKLHLETALQAWRRMANKYWEIITLTSVVEYELAKDDQAQAAKHLVEVKRLISQYGQSDQAPRWQSLLLKYRRSLTGHSTRQAAAD